jgi:hypothetical protein
MWRRAIVAFWQSFLTGETPVSLLTHILNHFPLTLFAGNRHGKGRPYHQPQSLLQITGFATLDLFQGLQSRQVYVVPLESTLWNKQ